ncbi:hypothetical protein GX563_03535 [Candidatus Bathyarchaeota archaeon]|mgnify:CR=1 FL=1|nr:hypothetical protein [Candidatus Bathyarchaeota archaeon]
MHQKAYEKYAWLILFGVVLVLGVRFFLFIVSGVLGGELRPDSQAVEDLTGMTWNELLALNSGLSDFYGWLEREISIIYISFIALMAIVIAVPYRKGHRWSWYAMWILPLFAVAITIHGGLVTGFSIAVIIQTVVLLFLILLGIILPYRKFFPSK